MDAKKYTAFFSIAIKFSDTIDNEFIVGSCMMFDINENRWLLPKYGHPYNYRERRDAPSKGASP